jgi:hypothetical protein
LTRGRRLRACRRSGGMPGRPHKRYLAVAKERECAAVDVPRVGCCSRLQAAMLGDIPAAPRHGQRPPLQAGAREDLVGGDWYDCFHIPPLPGHGALLPSPSPSATSLATTCAPPPPSARTRAPRRGPAWSWRTSSSRVSPRAPASGRWQVFCVWRSPGQRYVASASKADTPPVGSAPAEAVSLVSALSESGPFGSLSRCF